jgi:hypothetical protein
MPEESPHTLARRSRPDFYFAVVRARDDEVVLYGN